MADTGGWEKLLLGGKKSQIHSPNPQDGNYGYYRLKMHKDGVQVVAEVYPFIGSDQWAWGVRFPEQTRLTGYNGDTGETVETRPYGKAKMVGGHCATLPEAQQRAEAAIKKGRPKPEESTA